LLDVERWAELRREHFVRGVGIKELARRYGIDRNTASGRSASAGSARPSAPPALQGQDLRTTRHQPGTPAGARTRCEQAKERLHAAAAEARARNATGERPRSELTPGAHRAERRHPVAAARFVDPGLRAPAGGNAARRRDRPQPPFFRTAMRTFRRDHQRPRFEGAIKRAAQARALGVGVRTLVF
jgi:hypothetical protein